MKNLEFKGTNTKWESVYNGLYYYIKPIRSSQALASTQINEYIGIDQNAMAANAKLIAAAPDLLENLIRCVHRLEENDIGNMYAVKRAKEAINKALK